MLEREKIVLHLKQPPNVKLFKTSGQVYSAKDFSQRFVGALKENEKEIVKDFFNILQSKIPRYLAQPLTTIESLAVDREILTAKSIGSRSAFLPEQKIKLKGCRPIPDLYFPHEHFDFGSLESRTEKILFGILSAENVMRELLAYLFFKKNKINILHEPLCVFEYVQNNRILGYCLVFNTPTDARLEMKEDYLDISVKDLIIISELQEKFNINVLGNEVQFKGIDHQWYSKEKADVLAKMNLAGGFRGILNSNIGNDIEYRKNFYICDFDTFCVIDLPENPTQDFLRAYIVWGIVELLKSSPLVWGFIKADELSDEELYSKIWENYTHKSSLWQNYKKNLITYADNKGWDAHDLENAILYVTKTKIFKEAILDNMVNPKVLKETYKPELSFYTPQGY